MNASKMEIIQRISQNNATESDIKSLRSSSTSDNVLQYNLFMNEHFGFHSAFNRFPLGSSFDLDSKYMHPIVNAMQEAVNLVCFDLLDRLDAESIDGTLVEFGVAQGGWLGPMLDHMDRSGKKRSVVGFDSFEGLSEPSSTHDYSFWFKGQLAFSLESAAEFLRAHERPHLQLVKGWFSETLKQPLALSIPKIAFAKIDCDIYEPSVDCLEYLRGRLVDGAILVFDDWCYDPDIGESKAFIDWFQTVPQYRFELIGFINWRLFFRVHHVG